MNEPDTLKPLRSASKEYYAKCNLNDSQMSQLEDMLAISTSKAGLDAAPDSFWHRFVRVVGIDGFVPTHKPRMLFAGIIALLVIALGTQLVLYSDLDIEQKIAEEIAYNHNKQMTPEVFSSSLDNIGAYLGKLDFPLIASKRFSTGNWEILGGRYCSISNSLAAQLKIRNKDTNKVHTFYQALVPQALPAELEAREIFVDGVKVDIWVEKGLLLGIAG